MSSLLLHPTPVAQWRSLVHEAQAAAEHHLDEELESYLVFLLMRFTERPDMAGRVLALHFLDGLNAPGRRGLAQLRDVGDQCLLYSGLFPDQAERRSVNLAYFVDMGRSAYQTLSDAVSHDATALYGQLAAAFVTLMDILHNMREIGAGRPVMDPLKAMEAWAETGSQYALRVLREVTDATPVRVGGDGPDRDTRLN